MAAAAQQRRRQARQRVAVLPCPIRHVVVERGPCAQTTSRARATTELGAQLTPSSRSPDEATVRNKMIYASSKDALHRRLEGIHVEIQATDYSEITIEASEWQRAAQRCCCVVYEVIWLTPLQSRTRSAVKCG